MSFRRNLNNAWAQMRVFFESNPHEELSLDDIAHKFGVTRRTAQNYAIRLKLQCVAVYRKRVEK